MNGIDIQTQPVKDKSTFQEHVIKIANQLQEESPTTFSMIQFSLRPSVGTTQDIVTNMDSVTDMDSVKDLGFDAFLIFYDQYSQNSQIDDFFNLFHKSNLVNNSK